MFTPAPDPPPTMKTHTRTDLAKTAPARTTEEGQDVPEHERFSWACSCGERCGVWYPRPDRAEASYERHLARIQLAIWIGSDL